MGIDVKCVTLQQRQDARAPKDGLADLIPQQSPGLSLCLEVDESGHEFLGIALEPPTPVLHEDSLLHAGEEPGQAVDVPERREVAGHPDVSLLRRRNDGEARRPLLPQGANDSIN